MRTLRMLIIAAAIAMLAVPAMASPLPLGSGSCPVNLQIMPIATVVAPPAINVAIATINSSAMGQSTGADYGTFTLTTNLPTLQVDATIQSPGISGGTWWCRAEGGAWNVSPGSASTRTLSGPFTLVPFHVFVQVTDVPMAANVWANNFVYDTTLTVTLSAP